MSKHWMEKSTEFEVYDARDADPGAFFPLITGLGDALGPGHGLRVIQSFDPVPLYAVMEAKGLEYETTAVSDDEVHVYFYRPALNDGVKVAAMRSHLSVDPGRVEAIEEIVKSFYEGVEPADLKTRFDSELGSITGAEFAFVEQKMTDHGVGDNEFEEHVEGLLDIFRQALDQEEDVAHGPGHPLHTMTKENEAILELAASITSTAEEADPSSLDVAWWTYALEQMWQVDLHYVRKENELFPRLEQKGFDKPSIVMWSLHDKIRDGLKGVRAALAKEDFETMFERLGPTMEELVGMTYKEAKILFPTCDAMLGYEEFTQIRLGDDEIGYCLIDPPPPWPNDDASISDEAPPADRGGEPVKRVAPSPQVQSSSGTKARPFVAPEGSASQVGAISLGGGLLTPEQIAMLLGHLPMDVAFTNEYDDTVFRNRSSAETGLGISSETIEGFKAGTLDSAGQWEAGSSGTWTQSVAVRDQEGNYSGYLHTRFVLAGL